MSRPPPTSTLFPYTTLFRSLPHAARSRAHVPRHRRVRQRGERHWLLGAHRSEEHTSELQSLRHLVCRLLLEKKNKRHMLHAQLGGLRPCETSSRSEHDRGVR